MNSVTLQADLENVTFKSVTGKAIKKAAYTIPNAPEPQFKDIQGLMAKRPLHPIHRPPLSR